MVQISRKTPNWPSIESDCFAIGKSPFQFKPRQLYSLQAGGFE